MPAVSVALSPNASIDDLPAAQLWKPGTPRCKSGLKGLGAKPSTLCSHIIVTFYEAYSIKVAFSNALKV